MKIKYAPTKSTTAGESCSLADCLSVRIFTRRGLQGNIWKFKKKENSQYGGFNDFSPSPNIMLFWLHFVLYLFFNEFDTFIILLYVLLIKTVWSWPWWTIFAWLIFNQSTYLSSWIVVYFSSSIIRYHGPVRIDNHQSWNSLNSKQRSKFSSAFLFAIRHC